MTPLPDANKKMIDNNTLTDIRRDMMKFAHLQLRDETLAEDVVQEALAAALTSACLLYTSPSPRDRTRSRMPSSA